MQHRERLRSTEVHSYLAVRNSDMPTHTAHGHAAASHARHGARHHYASLAVMAGLSFVSMYLLMYSMVDSIRNVYPSFNQLYMAGLMTAPMVIIELGLMGRMYPNKTANRAILVVSALALVLFFTLIRQQAAIFDKGFLQSMIPHHAGAILMCQRATLSDPQIKQLCAQIVEGQQQEIDQMKAKLAKLGR